MTVTSPFEQLQVPFVEHALPPDIRARWVRPFYLKRPRSEGFVEQLRVQFEEIDEALVVALLSSTNWRPRIVGGYLAAAANLVSLEEHLGRLFLRSDACYAGRGYCLALSCFNTPAARTFVRRYLDHYLQKPECRFEQGDAMAALSHFDTTNGTALSSEYQGRWQTFVAGKNWVLPDIVERFEGDRLALVLAGSGG